MTINHLELGALEKPKVRDAERDTDIGSARSGLIFFFVYRRYDASVTMTMAIGYNINSIGRKTLFGYVYLDLVQRLRLLIGYMNRYR